MSNSEWISTKVALPIGTHIVTRVVLKTPAGETLAPRGAVGVVVEVHEGDTTSYRIRFPDGIEAVLRRDELSIRKQVQREGIQRSSTGEVPVNFYDYVIYRCVVGSRAYGLEESESDTDRRGIYLPPANVHWSLSGAGDQLENNATEECYWELQKFLVLALKANPNVLECLYTPLVERATPLAEDLLGMREAFLSQLIYQTYNGYVMSQFKKMEQDLRNTGSLKWKHVMHLIRLLLSGVTVLREGFVPVRVGEHREQLLAIRRGEVPWEEVNNWRLALHKAFDVAVEGTRLPERPDYGRVNEFLIKARRSMVDHGRDADGA